MPALRLYFLFPIWDLGHNPAPVPGGENLDTTRSSENFSSLYDPAVALDFFQFAGKPQKIAKGTTLFSENRKGMPLLLMPNRIYRSEEHTSELQSHSDLVCRLLLEKKRAHV